MEEVAFQENGTKVAAVNTKTYIFQREMSRGPESDLIRTINIPAVVRDPNLTTVSLYIHSFVYQGFRIDLQTVMNKFHNALIANLVSSYMRSLGVGLFATRTVGELLWGYRDNLLTSLKKFDPEVDDVFGLFYKV